MNKDRQQIRHEAIAAALRLIYPTALVVFGILSVTAVK